MPRPLRKPTSPAWTRTLATISPAFVATSLSALLGLQLVGCSSKSMRSGHHEDQRHHDDAPAAVTPTPGTPTPGTPAPSPPGASAPPSPSTSHSAVEGPAVMHLAYFRGEPMARQLVYAVRRSAAPWHALPVTMPLAQARYQGRATLQVDATGGASLAYQFVDAGLATPGTRHLELAKIAAGEGVMTQRELAQAPIAAGLGDLLSSALESHGTLALVHVRESLIDAGLLFSAESAAAGAAPLQVERAPLASYKDVALASDTKGGLDLAYVAGDSLQIRSRHGDTWGDAQTIPTPGCTSVTLATLAPHPNGTLVAAYTCTVGASGPRQCKLGLARSVGAGHETWKSNDVATLDPALACTPFASARPALAVDAKGTAHLAYRYTSADHPGLWDIAYATDGGGAARPVTPMQDWSVRTGSPALALDGGDRAFVAYLVDGHIRLADATGAFVPQTFAPDDAASGAQILELSDLSITGGRSRSMTGDQ